MEGVLDLHNGVVSEKIPHMFSPLLPTKYMTVFSGRTDTPEVKCDLTSRTADVCIQRFIEKRKTSTHIAACLAVPFSFFLGRGRIAPAHIFC